MSEKTFNLIQVKAELHSLCALILIEKMTGDTRKDVLWFFSFDKMFSESEEENQVAVIAYVPQFSL